MPTRESARRSLTGISASRAFFTNQNIERIKKLLATDLPYAERETAERRFAKEEVALRINETPSNLFTRSVRQGMSHWRIAQLFWFRSIAQ
jgi:hypothetical protein